MIKQDVNRRDFLKIIGIGGASAALANCTERPSDKLIPYLVPPDNIVPGIAAWYATVCRECPAGCGMLVRTREGRAVKVEGNPLHPVNRGRLCVRGQASLQGLYNPDRIRQPLRKVGSGEPQSISWEEGEKLLVEKLKELRSAGKIDRMAFLTPLITGSLDRLVTDGLAALGGGRRVMYEAFAYEPLRAANRITFGREAIPEYKIDEAEALISFGADFLETWISNVDYAGAFRNMHALRNGKIGKFIHVEPRMSLTAANADEWVMIRPGTEALLALGMIHATLKEGMAASSVPAADIERVRGWVAPYTPEMVAGRTDVPADRVRRLARAFAQAKPGLALSSGVATSGRNATATAVAVNLLNYVTGNVGQTVRFGADAGLGKVSTFADMLSLTQAMSAGNVDVLLIYDINPLFTLPRSTNFAAALERVPFVVSFSSFMDETTAQADLILPTHTPLESWGDYEPRAGVRGLMQPTMPPVFDTKPLGDVLLSVIKQVDETAQEKFAWETFQAYLQDAWKEAHQTTAPDKDFRVFWEESLRRGGVWESKPAEPVQLALTSLDAASIEPAFEGGAGQELHLMVYPSPHHFDGRGANKPWLQEITDAVTKIAWDNWVEVHPDTAHRLGLAEGDVVTISSAHGQVELPVHLYWYIRPDTVAIPLGQGHTQYGRYAQGRGANPAALLPAQSEAASGGLAWFSTKVQLAKTGRVHQLVSSEGSQTQEGRGIAQVVSVEEALRHERHKEEEHVPDMYPEHEHKDHRWGMAIDLQSCIGCNACVAACYAENNLAIVGKEEMRLRREMGWIRIERYYEGSPERPDTRFIPMLCQQCDNAPCEPVCPVYATMHNDEGLNAMVYNRCVGTRYCSNNCPYKVRQFNFFEYTWPEPLNWQLNPDVTVRSKGVMEKCTFCVQRIAEVKDRAKDEKRPVRDDEITPACAQTCPTEAIIFGDLKDPQSWVSQRSQDARRYRVLEVLNTKPAITYLKKVRQDERG
ncbi:MAG: molybdopterin-dependent oxidoreductase [Acidobacteria bacterium]|nr:molybdopterin-dependent oxidoreductase [Acidobacteriota bacterium]